jgi:hypothetical protein
MTASTMHLPFAPLEQHLAGFLVNREPCTTPAGEAQLLQVDCRSIYRWRAEGISANVADRLCHRLGIHPAEVWAAWLDDVAEVA